MHKTALSVPFQYRGIAEAFGARWDSTYRVHLWPGDPKQLPEQLTPFRAPRWSWTDHVEREINDLPIPKVEGPKKLTPRPHQLEAIQWIHEAYHAGAPGFLLADDLGLGKTLVAWEALRTCLMPGLKVAIVAPLNVLGNWQETLADRGTNGIEVILLNYDRLRVFFEVDQATSAGKKSKFKKGRTLKGVARFGEIEEVDALIFDESQWLKNPQSARSQLAFRLLSAASFAIYLSGSPGQSVLELSYLLPLLRYQTGGQASGPCTAEALETWASRAGIHLKRGAYGKWDYEDSNEGNEKVSKIIFSNGSKPKIACRRTPQQIAGWPELQRILEPIELNEEQKAAYQESWQELRAAVLQTPTERRREGSSPAMVSLMRFRQKASLLRVDQTADLAESLIYKGHQVAISVEFLDTMQALSEALTKRKISCVTLSGQSGNEVQRKQITDRYNNGEVPVIIFSVCEGINLQQEATKTPDKPRAQITHDCRWSGLKAYQIDGRSHRNGKRALVYWTYARGTVEIEVICRVLARLKAIHTLVGEDAQLVTELQEAFWKAAERPSFE